MSNFHRLYCVLRVAGTTSTGYYGHMSPTQAVAPAPTSASQRDGRDARWEGHRAAKRRELVEATLRAIRKHGPSVGMDEIAAVANTSKTVLYRHLGDRCGVYRATVAAVDQLILTDLSEAARQASPRDQIAGMVRAYLTLVERDPDIYRFVMARPTELESSNADADPVRQLTGQIGHRIAEILTGPELQLPAEIARVWGHGIVGMVQAAADQWLADNTPVTVEGLTDTVVSLIQPALTNDFAITTEQDKS